MIEETWPPPWIRAVGFMFGLAIFVWAVTVDRFEHPMVLGLAFVLVSLPLRQGLEALLDLLVGPPRTQRDAQDQSHQAFRLDRARSAYARGDIEIEEFESCVDGVLRDA